MSEPLQLSRAVRGFPRRPPTLQILAMALLAVAIVLLAPEWWARTAASAVRWPSRFWLIGMRGLAATALWTRGRSRTATVIGRPPRPPAFPLFVHVALLLAVAAAVAAAVGVLLWRVLGQPDVEAVAGQQSLPGATAVSVWSTRDLLDVVKVVLTIVGGIGAVVALTVAYRRQRLQEVETYREDTKVMLDRYCRAAELLGSPDASVRVAGIYAYAALANDALEARQGCIDVLCAYLRQPYDSPTAPDAGDRQSASAKQPDAGAGPAQIRLDPRQERHVRLTIIRLIRDNLCLPDDDPRTWRGLDFNFTGAVFDGGDQTGATFNGTGTVTFADATITGPLSFAGATFAGGTVSFDGARFPGGSALFTGGIVDLSKVNMQQPPPAAELWPARISVPAGLKLPATTEAQPEAGGVSQ